MLKQNFMNLGFFISFYKRIFISVGLFHVLEMASEIHKQFELEKFHTYIHTFGKWKIVGHKILNAKRTLTFELVKLGLIYLR